MKNIETVGKIVRIYPINEFKSGEREGKVGSLLLGDETGTIRVVFWNKMTEELEKLKENEILHIKDTYLKDNSGRLELHFNDSSKLVSNPKGETIETIKTNSTQRKKIQELNEHDTAELLGTIVQVYEPRFFEICPECQKRVRIKEEKFNCNDHGDITPDYSFVFSLFLDDGSGSIRTVLWQQQAQDLLKMDNIEILKFKDNIETFDPIKNDLLGTIIKVDGRVVKNTMFDRLEFSAQNINIEPNPDEELERLDKELETIKEVE